MTAAVFGALSFALLAASCSKREAAVEDGLGADVALVEKTFNDVQSISDQAAEQGTLSTYRVGATILGSCATITHDTAGSTRILTVDFGPAACLCEDGVYRRGKIIVEYNGAYKAAGYTHTINFVNYFVNDNEVLGTKTVTQAGLSGNGLPYYNITENGSIILANSAGTLTWLGTRTRSWKEGYNTRIWADDVYDIAGSGNLIRATGKAYSYNITTPLNLALSCRWIRSGVLEITPQGSSARTLNFGSGACDALAVYTIDGTTYNINLR